MNSYQVRRVKIGTNEQLKELAHECGQLYSQTLIFLALRNNVGEYLDNNP